MARMLEGLPAAYAVGAALGMWVGLVIGLLLGAWTARRLARQKHVEVVGELLGEIAGEQRIEEQAATMLKRLRADALGDLAAMEAGIAEVITVLESDTYPPEAVVAGWGTRRVPVSRGRV